VRQTQARRAASATRHPGSHTYVVERDRSSREAARLKDPSARAFRRTDESIPNAKQGCDRPLKAG
jgi:hypothetical protein